MKSLSAACHCGAVNIQVSHPPEYLNDCNCSLCRSAGALWGYYLIADVAITGETQSYTRADKTSPAVQLHFCRDCGTTSHWTLTETYVLETGVSGHMGVNMRLFDESDLIGVELRFPDGKAWSGDGDYTYRKAPVILGSALPDKSDALI